jgi:ubiquinone/menaquinone biosynthesis C-methylase UbiE
MSEMQVKPLAPLEFTGERMMPEHAALQSVWEHIYRYRFASQHVPGRDVLDVACGEGYGSASLLKAGARSVIGVDVDPATCEYARQKYGIDARQGNATALPFAADSFDLVVSFETIEHVAEPTRFLDECARVLKRGGHLVISTPNVKAYNPTNDPNHNPFHCSEMTESEFLSAVGQRFSSIRRYSQLPAAARNWSPRSLRLIHTPWEKVKGFWRLQVKCRARRHDVEHEVRNDPVSEILRPESWVSRMVNPYVVTPRSKWSGEQPTYLVCVAKSAK